MSRGPPDAEDDGDEEKEDEDDKGERTVRAKKGECLEAVTGMGSCNANKKNKRKK